MTKPRSAPVVSAMASSGGIPGVVVSKGITAAYPLRVVGIRALLSSVFLCVVSSFCRSQTHNVVCSDGYGEFEAKFTTGVTGSVGPARNGKLARLTAPKRAKHDVQQPISSSSERDGTPS